MVLNKTALNHFPGGFMNRATFYFLSPGWTESTGQRLSPEGIDQVRAVAQAHLMDLPNWDGVIVHPDNGREAKTACVAAMAIGNGARHLTNGGLTSDMDQERLKLWMTGAIAGRPGGTFVVAMSIDVAGRVAGVDVLNPFGAILYLECEVVEEEDEDADSSGSVLNIVKCEDLQSF